MDPVPSVDASALEEHASLLNTLTRARASQPSAQQKQCTCFAALGAWRCLSACAAAGSGPTWQRSCTGATSFGLWRIYSLSWCQQAERLWRPKRPSTTATAPSWCATTYPPCKNGRRAATRVGGLCHERPAFCRAVTYVAEIIIMITQDRAGWRAATESLLQHT